MRILGLIAAAVAASLAVHVAAAQTVSPFPIGETVVEQNRTTGAKLVVIVRSDAFGVVSVGRDGTRMELSAIPNPSSGKPFECPAGQTLSCHEDHVNQMSVCVCVGRGGGGGGDFAVWQANHP
jgi:hypothetical protein